MIFKERVKSKLLDRILFYAALYYNDNIVDNEEFLEKYSK
jgi:hypothetical protein